MQRKNVHESAKGWKIYVSKKQWLGFVLLFLILWGISFYLWFQVELDRFVLFSLNNSHFNEGIVYFIHFFSRYGMAVIVFIYLCYLVLSDKINHLINGQQIFLLILLSFAFTGITGEVLKEVFDRARPVVKYAENIVCLSNPGTASFPSGHASKSAALVIPFLFFAGYKGRGHSFVKIVLMFLALVVCFARIFLGAHYPSDVLAGIGLVFLCLPVSVVMANRITKKMTYKKFEFSVRIWMVVYTGLFIFLIVK
ncbi:phosphatase PAP2 family protein [candidate division KSB1 bacterium]|nr:phosphatase PAP2 family protein [candidate division KSB1 bacterium]